MTRKLTLDYGLRYDYQTYLKEQYGRMPDTVFNVPNPATSAGWGPRFLRAMEAGAAIASSLTIIRMRSVRASELPTRSIPRQSSGEGYGIQYSAQPNNAFLSYNDTVFYAVSGPGYGVPFMKNLTSGNPFAPGNAQRLGAAGLSEL